REAVAHCHDMAPHRSSENERVEGGDPVKLFRCHAEHLCQVCDLLVRNPPPILLDDLERLHARCPPLGVLANLLFYLNTLGVAQHGPSCLSPMVVQSGMKAPVEEEK